MRSPQANFTKKAARPASKTSAAYWATKIFLEGKGDWQSTLYFVRIQAHGERRKLKLTTAVREDAAKEAATQYIKIMAEGWPARAASPSAQLSPSPCATVKTWIDLATKNAHTESQTVKKYADALRTIASEILGLRRARKPTDRQRIDNFPISMLDRDKLQSWVNSRLERARELGPVKSQRAKNTIRSVAVNARCIFSERLSNAVGEPTKGKDVHTAFESLILPSKVVARYTSKFDAVTLLATAARELGMFPQDRTDKEATSKYEQWKILYLALVAGLRYNEIDKLLIINVNALAGRVSVRTHDEFRTKTVASEADVNVSPAAAAILTEMLKSCEGKWFVAELRSHTNLTYRSGMHHDRLVQWLRRYEERGHRPLENVPKPVHELRKEAGTLVNSQHGLNEAKNFLRHSSISTTATYYLGGKDSVTTGLA